MADQSRPDCLVLFKLGLGVRHSLLVSESERAMGKESIIVR